MFLSDNNYKSSFFYNRLDQNDILQPAGADAKETETVPGLEDGILPIELIVQPAIHSGFPLWQDSQRDGIVAGFVLLDLLDPPGYRQDLIEI